MDVRELSIGGAWEFTPTVHLDHRGVFLEWYRHEPLIPMIDHPIEWKQANLSVSGASVLRGIHYSLSAPGQAKYVTAVNGAALDFIIDIRVGSPTFAQWDCVRLDDTDRRAVYLSEGLGHAFLALEESTTLTYLCSEVYSPDSEYTLDPLDPEIGLRLPVTTDLLVLSDRDAAAPSLRTALAAGHLPVWEPRS